MSTSSVDAELTVIPLVDSISKSVEPVISKVPPSSMILSASADTGTLPKCLSFEIDKMPPSISTPPSKVLFEEVFKVSVPACTVIPLSELEPQLPTVPEKVWLPEPVLTNPPLP